MSIYDREYIRVGPRSTSGLGSLGLISFNSWIIILNVAVFLINIATIQYAVPVRIDRQINPDLRHDVPEKDQQAEGFLRNRIGERIPPTVSRIVEGPRGRELQTFPSPAYRYGGGGYLFILDSRSGEHYATDTVQFMSPIEAWGHFSTATGFLGTQLWRFITFQFLHANITHLLFNMFGLWVFGGMVEQYLGGKRYAAFYLTCGIFGAVSYLILNLLGNVTRIPLPGVLPDSIYTPLIGASAGVFGVILASAYIAPNAMVVLLFPPIPLKLKWLAYGYFLLAVANLLRGGANAGGDAAHVGGAIAGAFFIRNAHLLRDFFEVFGSGRGGRARGPGRDVSQDEIDRILRKVAQQGLRSLSDDEKRTLQRASERMRR